MRIVDAATVARSLPYPQLIAALREGLAGPIAAPRRVAFDIDGRANVLVMPAWTDRYLGIKTVNVFPGNTALGKPALNSSYQLSDGATGEALALIDGDALTGRRTAAVAALGASFLASPEADHLLLVGSGHVAREMPAAFAAVRPIRRVSVWSRNDDHAGELARSLADQGFATRVCRDLAADVAGAPIIVCATLATEPLIAGNSLRADAHLCLVGGFRPTMREADSEAITRAFVVADTGDGVLAEAGDLLIPMTEGLIGREHVRADLPELCRGDRTVPPGLDQPTIFKSVGHAAQDLIAASLIARMQ